MNLNFNLDITLNYAVLRAGIKAFNYGKPEIDEMLLFWSLASINELIINKDLYHIPVEQVLEITSEIAKTDELFTLKNIDTEIIDNKFEKYFENNENRELYPYSRNIPLSNSVLNLLEDVAKTEHGDTVRVYSYLKTLMERQSFLKLLHRFLHSDDRIPLGNVLFICENDGYHGVLPTSNSVNNPEYQGNTRNDDHATIITRIYNEYNDPSNEYRINVNFTSSDGVSIEALRFILCGEGKTTEIRLDRNYMSGRSYLFKLIENEPVKSIIIYPISAAGMEFAPDVLDIARKPELYLLAIGINGYTQMTPLQYAESDARTIAALFRGQEGQIFKKVHTRIFLSNSKVEHATEFTASKENIIEKGFKWLLREPGKEDIVIIFLSGHGFEDEGNYYFVPIDAIENNFSDTSINHLTIKEYITSSRADRRILIADTCRKEAKSSRQSSLVTSLADKCSILMASNYGEYAREIQNHRHGVLTQAILESFECTNTSEMITFEKLIREVPQKMFSIIGDLQHPVCLSTGRDITLGMGRKTN